MEVVSGVKINGFKTVNPYEKVLNGEERIFDLYMRISNRNTGINYRLGNKEKQEQLKYLDFIKKFDINGNDKIDPEEKAAYEEYLKKLREKEAQQAQQKTNDTNIYA